MVAEPGLHPYTLTVSAQDNDKNTISDDSTTNVVVADSTKLEVTLRANPASWPAPGGLIEETVLIRNLSTKVAVELNSLRHSVLGNLNDVGNCLLPQTVAAEESFDCSFEIEVTGTIGDLISHIVAGAGVTEGGSTVGNVDQVSILLFDPARRQNWLPVVAMPERHPEEDNDSPCTAFPLENGEKYTFAIDDQYDWYYFDVLRNGTVNIQIENLSADAQVAVFANQNCDQVNENDLVSYNGDDNPNKTMVFSADVSRHFVFIADLTARSFEMPYSITVQTP